MALEQSLPFLSLCQISCRRDLQISHLPGVLFQSFVSVLSHLSETSSHIVAPSFYPLEFRSLSPGEPNRSHSSQMVQRPINGFFHPTPPDRLLIHPSGSRFISQSTSHTGICHPFRLSAFISNSVSATTSRYFQSVLDESYRLNAACRYRSANAGGGPRSRDVMGDEKRYEIDLVLTPPDSSESRES